MKRRGGYNQPGAQSSPSERQNSQVSHDPLPELSDETDSDCSSSEETSPCCENSSLVDDISLTFSNNVSLGSPKFRRHSSPPSDVSHREPSPSSRKPLNRIADSPEKSQSSSASSFNLIWLLIPLIVICLVISFLVNFRSQMSSCIPGSSCANHNTGASTIDFKGMKSSLHEAFPTQPNTTWAVFAAQLRSLLQENPPPARPAVVLLVGPLKSRTLRCLERRLGGTAAVKLGGTSCRMIASEGEQAGSEDAEKLAMDQEVTGAYKRDERCFHFSHLEQASKQQLLLMHAWCDGDHSPFKRAFFLLVLRSKEQLLDERSVEKFVVELWNKKVGPDEAGALNSRLANSVIIVREEKSPLQEHSCVDYT